MVRQRCVEARSAAQASPEPARNRLAHLSPERRGVKAYRQRAPAARIPTLLAPTSRTTAASLASARQVPRVSQARSGRGYGWLALAIAVEVATRICRCHSGVGSWLNYYPITFYLRMSADGHAPWGPA